MRLKSLDFFFRSFAEEQMNFLYTGDFSDELTDRLIDLNSHQLSNIDGLKSSQRKAAFLIAECFQNIVRHSDLSNQSSYFHIKNNQGLFNIISGNTIENNLIPDLKGKLEQLNELTSEELKEVYLKTLQEVSFSDKGGAGLGLIEMARKTKNKLSFSFSEIDLIKSYFYFQLQLNSAELIGYPIDNNFDKSISLRNKMLEDELFLVYKGTISTPIAAAILGIIENTIETHNQKVVFIKLMSFFEKISAQTQPLIEEDNSQLLFVGENDAEYNIGISCLLDSKEALSIERTLRLYQTFDKRFLEKEYKRVLKEGNTTSLTLIELLRSTSQLDFDVHNHAPDTSCISLILRFKKKKKMISTHTVSKQKERQAQLSSSHGLSSVS